MYMARGHIYKWMKTKPFSVCAQKERSFWLRAFLRMYFPFVTDGEGKDNKPGVLYIANQTIVTYAISPLAAPVGCQAFTVDPWIRAADKLYRFS